MDRKPARAASQPPALNHLANPLAAVVRVTRAASVGRWQTSTDAVFWGLGKPGPIPGAAVLSRAESIAHPAGRRAVLKSARRVRQCAAALEAAAMGSGPIDRAAAAQLRDEVARASTELLDDLERWLSQLDEEDW